MSINEMMVGDWLYIKDHPMRKEAKQVVPEHFVRSLVEFEPILLTVDILKKNFQCYEYFDEKFTQYYMGHCDIQNTNTSTCRIHYHYYTRNNNCYENIKAGFNIVCGDIQLKYVHQLQQFLRLVGYKGEIKL